MLHALGACYNTISLHSNLYGAEDAHFAPDDALRNWPPSIAQATPRLQYQDFISLWRHRNELLYALVR